MGMTPEREEELMNTLDDMKNTAESALARAKRAATGPGADKMVALAEEIYQQTVDLAAATEEAIKKGHDEDNQ